MSTEDSTAEVNPLDFMASCFEGLSSVYIVTQQTQDATEQLLRCIDSFKDCMRYLVGNAEQRRELAAQPDFSMPYRIPLPGEVKEKQIVTLDSAGYNAHLARRATAALRQLRKTSDLEVIVQNYNARANDQLIHHMRDYVRDVLHFLVTAMRTVQPHGPRPDAVQFEHFCSLREFLRCAVWNWCVQTYQLNRHYTYKGRSIREYFIGILMLFNSEQGGHRPLYEEKELLTEGEKAALVEEKAALVEEKVVLVEEKATAGGGAKTTADTVQAQGAEGGGQQSG